MRKRPLVITAVLFIIIEIILSEGLNLYDRSSPSEILLQQNKQKAVVIGTVIKKEDKEKSRCLYLKNVKIIFKDQIYNESKILAYTGKNQQVKIGNKIKSVMDLECIEGPRNPGNFNEKEYYRLKKIGIRGYGNTIEVIDDHINFIEESMYTIRSMWKENIQGAIKDKYSGILLAILTGDKSTIDKDIKSLFVKNGIGHILAISGLHMSFIGMAVYDILRRFKMSYLTSASGGVLILLFYCVITGNSVSAKRAFIMYIIRMGAEVTGRTYDMPISISIGAMIIVMLNVRYLHEPGFLLSFGALAGLGIVYPCLKKHIPAKKHRKLVDMLMPGICITLVCLPVTLYFFYEYPLYSVFLNLIIIPLMSLIMIFGVTGSIASLIIPGKMNILLKGCEVMFFVFEKICFLFSKLPFWRIVTGKISLLGVIIYYTFLITFLYYISVRNKKVIINGKTAFKATAVLLICIYVTTPGYKFYKGKADITMVDVGQGDGILIQDQFNHNYFVDGGSTDIKNVGENRIIPFLLSKGVSKIDYCFISHGDNDHKNGIEEILKDQDKSVKIKAIVLPDKKFWDKGLGEVYKEARKVGVKVYSFKKGSEIKNGEFALKFIFPSNEYVGPCGNEASMVFEMKYKNFNMLFTGDLEGAGEKMVENDPCLHKVSVLKTAHHGSDGSTSIKFLEKTNPEAALISCGINNRYGHPGKNTLDRLKKCGADIYCTNEKGAINIVTNGKTFKVTTFLK